MKNSTRPHRHRRRHRVVSLFCLCLLSLGFTLGVGLPLVRAQSDPEVSAPPVATPAETSPSPSPKTAIATPVALPTDMAEPIVAPPTAGQYILEFNRSPVVGNRLRLEGIYDEARLQFTRPLNWNAKSVRVLLRFRHSGALYASRSNLTVLINGTSVGSVPMDRPQGEIASVVFDVPPTLIQDYNEVVVAALQNNSPTCTQDPYDPSLWSEILPDSKIVFDFQPQPVALNFARYPYPIFDQLSLESNRVAYLLPSDIDEEWLTEAGRFHAALGRIADYRELESRVIPSASDVEETERLIVIGTPQTQPTLADFDLPLSLTEGRWLDANDTPVPDEVGVLMLTTTQEDRVPVLVATGNSEAAVNKAVQFLVQSSDRQIGTGHVIFVHELNEVASPPPRQWPGYLPMEDLFQLKDLRQFNNQSTKDITVWGSHSPAIDVDFHALPDDHFLPGNSMTLRYSYGPQINPLTSLIEITLDGVALGGKRLSSINGGDRETLTVSLPEGLIQPSSKLQVNFRLDPRERRSCSRVTDQQLWGTIHNDTQFELNRESVSKLPNLELVRFGYPFAAPQDLSATAIALPDKPTATDLNLMLEVSERLGRLSSASSVQMGVYPVNQLPADVRANRHLIAIGTRSGFPFPDTLSSSTFALGEEASRQWQKSAVQTLPDAQGMVQQVLSPWNRDRVLMTLSSQTPEGLQQVQDLIRHDPLFYQIQGDTVLISANTVNPSPYNSDDYNLEFLRQAPQRTIVAKGVTNQIAHLIRGNWFILVPGIIIAAVFIYGVLQLYLKRLAEARGAGE